MMSQQRHSAATSPIPGHVPEAPAPAKPSNLLWLAGGSAEDSSWLSARPQGTNRSKFLMPGLSLQPPPRSFSNADALSEAASGQKSTRSVSDAPPRGNKSARGNNAEKAHPADAARGGAEAGAGKNSRRGTVKASPVASAASASTAATQEVAGNLGGTAAVDADRARSPEPAVGEPAHAAGAEAPGSIEGAALRLDSVAENLGDGVASSGGSSAHFPEERSAPAARSNRRMGPEGTSTGHKSARTAPETPNPAEQHLGIRGEQLSNPTRTVPSVEEGSCLAQSPEAADEANQTEHPGPLRVVAHGFSPQGGAPLGDLAGSDEDPLFSAEGSREGSRGGARGGSGGRLGGVAGGLEGVPESREELEWQAEILAASARASRQARRRARREETAAAGELQESLDSEDGSEDEGKENELRQLGVDVIWIHRELQNAM